MPDPVAAYHQLSSYDRMRMEPHIMDWDNEPSVYKHYSGRHVVPLPPEVDIGPVSLTDLLQRQHADQEAVLSRSSLSNILLLSEMLTARARHAQGEIWFRSVASAGALYPNELYVACPGIAGLAAGLYHYDIRKPALALIRSGNPLPALAGDERDGRPALVFLVSAIFFRSSWKYRDRAYRYHLLDSGHLLENLSLALKAFSLSYEVMTDFNDDRVNGVLGVDPRREVCLVMVRVPLAVSSECAADAETLESAGSLPRYSQVAGREKACQAVLDIHQASAAGPARPACRPGNRSAFGGLAKDLWQSLPSPSQPAACPYPDVLLHRRSKRNFVVREPLPPEHLSALLGMLAADDGEQKGPSLISTAVVLGNVAGFEPGLYGVAPGAGAVVPVAAGNFSRHLAHACLDQQWMAAADLHLLFFADLDEIVSAAGFRGYRQALVAAGRMGQRLYLGASSMGLGCCAVGAFYDREAIELLGFDDRLKLLYVVAVGRTK
ncbi:MAG: SagB/ThcOx family dehydrogenase [Deltaproteobacteria bacterium]|nr:SagB/ThcOx family dehydrogenase [Candidatus Anaeroferrophillus wilburensis]MBN2887919.1 SagB/ThcOx family dehydrogenase [Deltaproteobacteria bacterium]